MDTEISLFEEKMRVLVVDDDPVCFKIIIQMLKQCNYKVTEVAKATEALETLRNNPKTFDMVITDTQNDVDVLSLIVKIMNMENIPVILVSGLDDTSTLIQGVVQGADEILSKPVSFSKIKTLWQHVYRRRLNQKDNPSIVSPELGPSASSSPMKEEEAEERDNEDESEHRRKRKRTRVRWQGSLQEKFLEAVMKLGGPKEAMPKKIMELMNVPVSRECVASHLQKYRKQKKPPIPQQNDTNSVVSSSFEQRLNSFHPSPLSRPCHHSMAPNFGYYHHHHNHHHQGFQHMSMGHNLMTMNACSSFPWRSPKLDPGLGRMPDHQPTMLPPHPSFVSPVSNRGGYTSNNNQSYELPPVPQHLPVVVTQTASMAAEVNNGSFTFSGDSWHDSGVLDAAFFSGLQQPEIEQWISEDYQIAANGMKMSAQIRDQLEDGAEGDFFNNILESNYINYI